MDGNKTGGIGRLARIPSSRLTKWFVVAFWHGQLGMILHWTRHLKVESDPTVRRRMFRSRAINTFGLVMTGVVLVVMRFFTPTLRSDSQLDLKLHFRGRAQTVSNPQFSTAQAGSGAEFSFQLWQCGTTIRPGQAWEGGPTAAGTSPRHGALEVEADRTGLTTVDGPVTRRERASFRCAVACRLPPQGVR